MSTPTSQDPDKEVSGAFEAALLVKALDQAERLRRYEELDELAGSIPGWAWWRLRRTPFKIGGTIGGLFLSATWLITTGLPSVGVEPEDHPYYTQGQGQTLECLVRQSHWMDCRIATRTGDEQAPPDCDELPDDPPECSPPG